MSCTCSGGWAPAAGAPAAGAAAAGGAGWAAGAAFGAAFGLACGAAAGGCWACASGTNNQAASALTANSAKTRTRGLTGAAKIRKFIAETLSERERPNRFGHRQPAIWAAVSVPNEADT